MSKTKSEELFEEYCKNFGIEFQRIPTNEEKSPDYDIFPNGMKVVVEVKQIDPNEDEQKELEKLRVGGCAVVGGTPGHRVRKLITKAGPQIRTSANGLNPSIIVIYNNVRHNNFPITPHDDPYMVRVAMYGLETHVIGVPKDYEFKPYLKDKKFGRNRKMTDEHNTSISAVCVLDKNRENILELRIYHNIHASIKLTPGLMRFPNTYHYSLGEKAQGQIQDWISI